MSDGVGGEGRSAAGVGRGDDGGDSAAASSASVEVAATAASANDRRRDSLVRPNSDDARDSAARTGHFRSDHESFLEGLARRECAGLPCREHNSAAGRHDRHPSDDDENWRSLERRRFMLLDFSSDDDVSSSDSDDDSSSEEEGEEEIEEEEEGGDGFEELFLGDYDNEEMSNDEGDDGFPSPSDDEGDGEMEPDNPLLGEEDESLDGGEVDRLTGHDDDDINNMDVQELANAVSLAPLPPAPLSSSIASNPTTLNIPAKNLLVPPSPNHQRMYLLLLSLANSEEEPLIRADIPWSALIACGSYSDSSRSRSAEPPSLLRTLYEQPSDPNGARLLQGVLRMDPPLEAARVILDAFPLSCLDMEGFFTACQFAHPVTSSPYARERKRLDPVRVATGKVNDSSDDEFDDDEETNAVGEVVKLVMRRTIRARHCSGVDWGMVAFLGDARIPPSHAKLLLRSAPEALIDPKHGAFGVSPLDRMASGFFIHGERSAWVEKLRLALRVAAYVRLRQERRRRLEEGTETTAPPKKIVLPPGFFRSDCPMLRRRESSDVDSSDAAKRSGSTTFHPYHELVRLVVSPSYKGNKFGQHGFLNTLKACTQSDPDAFLRPDGEGNLPIHVALRDECDTVLGVKGERRLIKYLLDLDDNVALCPEGGGGDRGGRAGRGRLPLRMSVENAWPVHDLIVDAALSSRGDAFANGTECKKILTINCRQESSLGEHVVTNAVLDRPLLHDALDGPCHPRFGIHGARGLVRTMLSRIAEHRRRHHQNERRKRNDDHGRLNSVIGEGEREHRLASLVDANGRTALHVALENVWPVYDLIVRADPPCLEEQDPTRHGFFPFQTAACAFTAGSARRKGEEDVERGKDGKDNVERGPDGTTTRTDSDARAPGVRSAQEGAAGEGPGRSRQTEEASLVETSMLFELIRESPLCVAWGTGGENDDGVLRSSPQRKSRVAGSELLTNKGPPPAARASRKRRRPPPSPNERGCS